MPRETVKSPDVGNVGVGNVFCSPSCFGRFVVLYFGKPVRDNKDSVEAF